MILSISVAISGLVSGPDALETSGLLVSASASRIPFAISTSSPRPTKWIYMMRSVSCRRWLWRSGSRRAHESRAIFFRHNWQWSTNCSGSDRDLEGPRLSWNFGDDLHFLGVNDWYAVRVVAGDVYARTVSGRPGSQRSGAYHCPHKWMIHMLRVPVTRVTLSFHECWSSKNASPELAFFIHQLSCQR